MKYLVGMSGGLDSTYVAHLLREQGHTVQGAILVMHDHTDLAAARRAADEVGILLHELDCRAIFEREVIAPFVSEYQNARTPNPCVLCNRHVKVGALCDFARANDFDAVVTGHYAKIARTEDGRYTVACAADPKKDQSYMLWQLTQAQLSLLQTPLCDTDKNEIRARARALGFFSAEAKESQDICFLPDGDYVSFVEGRIGKMPKGNFIAPDGTVLGEHKGILHYTVGQRKGLGLACNQPVFVSEIDAKRNTVTVTPSGGEYARGLTATCLNFVAFAPPTEPTEAHLTVKIRYSASRVGATVRYDASGMQIVFDAPQRAITPGQSVVCYDGDRVALGGIIDERIL